MEDHNHPFVPYHPQSYTEDEMLRRSNEFYLWANKRRSVRNFSDRPVPREVMENIILTASTAPSGAHKQPWTFCLISSKELKSELRRLAEEEERKSYEGRMSQEWLKDLEPLGTNAIKEFIEVAPWIVVIMKRVYEVDTEGIKHQNYYVSESVGIAAGFFLAAVHNAGLVALTHTPSPMNFIAQILKRPENERPFLLIPVGYAADQTLVPDLKRKGLHELIEYYE